MDDLPVPCLVVLVGPSGAGKSAWAAAHFDPGEVVSSDHLRAVVGHGEDDLDATDDAFALLDQIVDQRLGRGLTAVVDTLGLDAARRAAYREAARRHGVPCVAIGFDTPAAECRARNRERTRPVPADALTRQLRDWRSVRGLLDGEGFDAVIPVERARPVAAHLRESSPLAAEQRSRPVGLRFGLHLAAFPWSGTPTAVREGLQAVAVAAEDAGFESVWVMDHLRQIPQVGRDWDPMLESGTALAFLAAATTRVRLGTLVTAVPFRPLALLGKAVATLDVLSGGRAVCGLGLGWYEREAVAYGLPFPSVAERYAILEDALQLLPLLWGPGAPSFRGRVVEVPEAICYPRPVQEHVPILVGGGGERRTLRLAARHADASNLIGDAATVAHKVSVLREHAVEAGRDPHAIEVTHLSPTLVGRDRAEVAALVDQLRPRRTPAARFAAGQHAGTIEEQVGRFRALADAGVEVAIVSLPDLAVAGGVEAVARFADVIAAFA